MTWTCTDPTCRRTHHPAVAWCPNCNEPRPPMPTWDACDRESRDASEDAAQDPPRMASRVEDVRLFGIPIAPAETER